MYFYVLSFQQKIVQEDTDRRIQKELGDVFLYRGGTSDIIIR